MTETLKRWWSCGLRLSRYKEYIFLIGPLTLLPAIHAQAQPSFKLVFLLLANLLSFAFAFAINEVEDAEDDAKDTTREIINPINTGEMSYTQAFWLSLGLGLLSVFCYSVLGLKAYFVGVLIFVLGLTYSWKPTRLKAKPGVDILSHGLALGTLQYLTGVVVFGSRTDWALIVSAIILITSFQGQIHNQLRDYKADRLAKLANTASFIRYEWLKLFQQGLLLTAAIMGLYLLFVKAIPLSLVLLSTTLLAFLALAGISVKQGSRPGEKLNLFLRFSLNAVFVANVVIVLWFIGVWQHDVVQLLTQHLGVSMISSYLQSLPTTIF